MTRQDNQQKPTGLYCECGNQFQYDPEPHPNDRPTPHGNMLEIENRTGEETRFAVFSEVRDYYPYVRMMCGECAEAVSEALRARWGVNRGE